MRSLALSLLLALPAAAAEVEPAARTQLFQIILLRGSATGVDDLARLPKNAEKAVADMREFLPFRSYQILDSGLLRSEEGGTLRLDGVPPQQYDVRIAFKMDGERLSVWHFEVAPAAPASAQPVKPVISTEFAIERGETIVVGSSKLRGGEALIVLFTAVK